MADTRSALREWLALRARLRDERRFHFEQAAADLCELGLTPREAKHQARARLGSRRHLRLARREIGGDFAGLVRLLQAHDVAPSLWWLPALLQAAVLIFLLNFGILSLCFILPVCVAETSGPDAMCKWPGDSTGRLDPNNPDQSAHLSHDAGKAEYIAIRYADGHSRPGFAVGKTMADYIQTRDGCMAALFQEIATDHYVTPRQVRDSAGTHRRASLDAMVMLSFGILYAMFVNRFVRGIWRRFPPRQDLLAGILATVVIGPVAGVLGEVLGELWAWKAETLRVGYGHLNLLEERIPWGHHRTELFVLATALFWMFSWLRYRDAEPDGPTATPVLNLGT
jgi:hypothetical protein